MDGTDYKYIVGNKIDYRIASRHLYIYKYSVIHFNHETLFYALLV